MNTHDIRRYQVLVRVGEFGVTHAELFPEKSLGGELFAAIRTKVGDLTHKSSTQTFSIGAELDHSFLRAEARATLLDRLRGLRRTARAIEITHSGVENIFQVPRSRNDERLISAARASADAAQPLSDQFIAHGHPTTFIADLEADIDAFAATIVDQSTARETHIGAGAGISETLAEAFEIVRRLDAIVPLAIGHDAETLAAWKTARRVARLRSKTTGDQPPAPPAKAAA